MVWRFLIGWVSSRLGTGGHVPALVYCLLFPLHIATATAHLTLALMDLHE